MNTNRIISTAITAVIMTALVTCSNAQGFMSMGLTSISGMTGVNLEFGNSQIPGRKGIYCGFDVGFSGYGESDFFTIYGGRARTTKAGKILKYGLILGAGSSGNTVWDLRKYGGGMYAGNDGSSSCVFGPEVGSVFPHKEMGAVSMAVCVTTAGAGFKIGYGLLI